MIIRVVQMRCEVHRSKLQNISILNHPSVEPSTREHKTGAFLCGHWAINAACRLKLVLVNPPERFTYNSYNTLQQAGLGGGKA